MAKNASLFNDVEILNEKARELELYNNNVSKEKEEQKSQLLAAKKDYNNLQNEHRAEIENLTRVAQIAQEKNGDDGKRLKNDDAVSRAYLLGFHIAQEHPDGSLLIRYLLTHRSISI